MFSANSQEVQLQPCLCPTERHMAQNLHLSTCHTTSKHHSSKSEEHEYGLEHLGPRFTRLTEQDSDTEAIYESIIANHIVRKSPTNLKCRPWFPWITWIARHLSVSLERNESMKQNLLPRPTEFATFTAPSWATKLSGSCAPIPSARAASTGSSGVTATWLPCGPNAQHMFFFVGFWCQTLKSEESISSLRHAMESRYTTDIASNYWTVYIRITRYIQPWYQCKSSRSLSLLVLSFALLALNAGSCAPVPSCKELMTWTAKCTRIPWESSSKKQIQLVSELRELKMLIL